MSKPSTRPVKQAPEKVSTLPSNPEAEKEVLGACLVEASDALDRCVEAGLTGEAFDVPANRVIYQTLLGIKMRGDVIDISVLAQELMEQRSLDAVGGMGYLMEVSQVQTSIRAGYFIEKVRQMAGKRAIIRQALALVEHAQHGDSLEEVQQAATELASGFSTPHIRRTPRAISDFAYPSDDDPNILIGKDDYLGKGGGLLFVSHAGAGKSSWVMDACMMWGLGRTWMGLRCARPLRSLIIQAEDSDRYIGKIASSFAFKNRLDEKETSQLGENCMIVRLKGVSGHAFFTELKRLTELHQPDLVIVNPIYLYAEGDIGRSEFAQPFLIGLDQVNKDEKFAYILIHHTGKPTAKVIEEQADIYSFIFYNMGIEPKFEK